MRGKEREADDRGNDSWKVDSFIHRIRKRKRRAKKKISGWDWQ